MISHIFSMCCPKFIDTSSEIFVIKKSPLCRSKLKSKYEFQMGFKKINIRNFFQNYQMYQNVLNYNKTIETKKNIAKTIKTYKIRKFNICSCLYVQKK